MTDEENKAEENRFNIHPGATTAQWEIALHLHWKQCHADSGKCKWCHIASRGKEEVQHYGTR